MAGSRRRLSILQPLAARFEGTRDLDEHKKLLRVGVLSFVEEDTIILFANSLREVWPLQQLHRERDLISISNRAASETELAVIPLHFCCDARRTCACPFSQRPKRFAPVHGKFSRCRCAGRRGRKLVSFAPAA